MRVNENEFFPADLVVLNSTEDQGVFYVETKNLDGETNLKLKSVSKDMQGTFLQVDAYSRLDGTFNIETPNNRIYKFDDNFDMAKMRAANNAANDSDVMFSSLVPLSNDNVALRGMSLRNTENVTGVVVYTGHESKI